MKPEIKQRIEQLNNGKIPKGYQKTDFGVFPSDWVTDETLGDLFDFYGGLSKSRDELGEEGYAYLHYGDLHRGTFNSVSIDQYEQLPKCDISLTGKEKCLMEDGDVAFLDASEDLEGTSRAVLIDNPENKPFIAGLHIIYGKSKNNSLDKWFKQYITSSESVKKQFQRLAVGFKVYGVNRDTIPRIKVAFPSSNKEQSRIAEILMKWDKAIELYDKQIDALTRYKAVCLRKMFPAKEQNVPEWRFRGFTGDWEQRKLGDISDSYSGGTPSAGKIEYYGGTIPFIRSAEINSDFTELFLTEEGLMNSSAKMINKGDILYALYGATSGEVGLARLDGAINQAILDIKPHVNYDSKYLLQWLRNSKDNIIRTYLQGGQGNLSGTIVASLMVDCPTFDEQKKIGAFFAYFDNLITLHQRKKETIINQRKALQRYLLNGIVRVKS